MRVLFVFPDMSPTVTNYTGVLSYGVGLLSALLQRAGHQVRLYHITENPTEQQFKDRVRAAHPDLVAFSSISHYAQRLKPWTTWAHEASDAPVVVGGTHATYAPEEVIGHPDVDYVCIGEGEGAIVELCDALEHGRDTSSIANLWARRGSEVVRNGPRAIVDDLDELPDPDFTIFDFDRLYSARQRTFTYLMSRGCAFRCTYCSAHTLMKVAPRTGKFWRFIAPAKAVAQIRRLLDQHLPDAELVSFGDAIFFPNKKWIAEFGPLYRDQIGLPISCNMRADMVTEETAAIMKDMGVHTVRLGVESGNQHMTRDILFRNLDVADIRSAYARLREHGMERWSYNIMGLPTETLSMALETVKLNAEIDPELALPFIFYPYPGTQLYDLCKQKGLLTDRELDHYKIAPTIKQKQFPDHDVLFVHRLFPRLIAAYQKAGRLPGRWARLATAGLDAALTSPLLPRRAIVFGMEVYRKLRHAVGEMLVAKAPSLYRVLGGRAPELRQAMARVVREGLARVDTP